MSLTRILCWFGSHQWSRTYEYWHCTRCWKALLSLAFVLLLASPSQAAITVIVAGGVAAGGSANSTTTGSVNATGGKTIVGACAQYLGGGGSGDAAFTDSSSNSYTLIESKADDSAGVKIRLFYTNTNTATVTGSMTFNCAGSSIYSALLYWVLAGTSATPLDQHANSQTPAATTESLNSALTPTTNGQIVIAAVSFGGSNATGFSVGGSMTQQGAYGGAVDNGGVGAYLIQTSAAALNPTFSWTNANIAAIAAATFAPPVTSTPGAMLLLGVGR